MFLEMELSDLTLILLALCLLPIIALMVYAIIVALKRRAKLQASQKVAIEKETDTTQSELFFSLFGGKSNIIAVTQEMSRVNVSVVNLELVKLEELKVQGATGILVVGNDVKCAFGDRAIYIYNLLKDAKTTNE
jgi:phosphotransferase system IIB component